MKKKYKPNKISKVMGMADIFCDCYRCKEIKAIVAGAYLRRLITSEGGETSGYLPSRKNIEKSLTRAGWVALLHGGFICPECRDEVINEKNPKQIGFQGGTAKCQEKKK